MESFQIPVPVTPRAQFRATYSQFCNEIFRLDPQRGGSGRKPDRLCRVGILRRIFPVGILAQKRLDALAMLLPARTVNRGEVINNEFQHLSWTGDSGVARNIEPVELELDRMRGIGVGTAHPFDQFAIRLEPSKAVTKSGVSHGLIGCRAATGDV